MIGWDLAEIVGGGAIVLGGTIAGAILHHRARPTYREYVGPAQQAAMKTPTPVRWEFMRETRGRFVPTGELIPAGQDPHGAVVARQNLEGVAYAARAVTKVNP